MKVVHVPYTFYPDPAGGTEVYVAALAAGQQCRGHTPIIAAPGAHNAAYTHAGLPVRRFAVSPAPALRELYGAGDAAAAAAFEQLLDAERPDLLHLHARSGAASLLLVRAARRRRIPVVFTYHTPTVSCQRGTLLRWGRDVCDGALRTQRCAACTLHGLGAGRAASTVLSRVPVQLGRALEQRGRAGGIWTALRMPALIEEQHRSLRALLAEANALAALCSWVRALLLRNGAAPATITLSRHGLTQALTRAAPAPRAAGGALRVASLGRLDPSKGADLLVRALRALPGAAIELDIYGVAQAGSAGYTAQLRRLAAADARVRILPPAPNEQVVALLAGYDVLAVPSQVLETGPLVVLEAFAAGTPVLGSALGGIAELVTQGANGLLVAPDSITAWRDALDQLSRDRLLLARLRAGVRPPRHMHQVVTEMLDLYAALQAGPA